MKLMLMLALLVFWLGLILIASFAPPRSGVAGTFTLGGRDFFAHAFAYFVLTLLAFGAITQLPFRSAAALPAAFLFPFALGALIEVLQPLVGRQGSLRDVGANSIGIAIAAVLAAAFMKFKP